MNLYYWKSALGNFGDDLNLWLWREFAPELWNDKDGIRFIGIGTILDRSIPQEGLNVVLGAGAGYASAPNVHGANWKIYGVRGPLTAKLLHLSSEAALTDPAILLARIERLKNLVRRGTCFVPHWKSLGYTQWEKICSELGIKYIDPCRDAEIVIRDIGESSLVLAESMHGAIVADALRVPWTPVATSPEISPFKWSDWAMSLEMTYRPLCLGPSCWTEKARNALSRAGCHLALFDRHLFHTNPLPLRPEFGSADKLLQDHAIRMKRSRSRWRRSVSLYGEALAKRMIRNVDAKPYPIAREQMRQAMILPGSLSTDKAHEKQLERMESALERLRQDYAAERLKQP